MQGRKLQSGEGWALPCVFPSVLSWLTLACSGLYPSWLFLFLSRTLGEQLSQVVGVAVT